MRRPKKLETLLDVRSRAVDSAESALAAATRQFEEAAAAVRNAEARYETALDETNVSRLESAWDAGYRRAHLEALRAAITRCANLANEAAGAQDRARAALVEAKREKKKLELWCDARAREFEAEDARMERIATDDLALRGSRK